MWIIDSCCGDRCDSDQQGSTGLPGLKGEVCSAARIHLYVSATYCFVYRTHWGAVSARKGQQGNQGREVKKVRWEVLDNLVCRAHQDLEGWWETQVCLVHLDLWGDLYGNRSLYERLWCYLRFGSRLSCVSYWILHHLTGFWNVGQSYTSNLQRDSSQWVSFQVNSGELSVCSFTLVKPFHCQSSQRSCLRCCSAISRAAVADVRASQVLLVLLGQLGLREAGAFLELLVLEDSLDGPDVLVLLDWKVKPTWCYWWVIKEGLLHRPYLCFKENQVWVERRVVLVGVLLETQAPPGLQVGACSDKDETFNVFWLKCLYFIQDQPNLFIYFLNNHKRSNWPPRLQSSRSSR